MLGKTKESLATAVIGWGAKVPNNEAV